MIDTTITLTRHREPNELIFKTLAGLANQQDVRASILFLDQSPDDETAIFCNDHNSDNITFDYRPLEFVSLSHARNIAIEACKTDTLLFIDADAIARFDWANKLAETLHLEGVGIAGGRIFLVWHKKPLFITSARVVHEQYSMLDYGSGMMSVPKIVGASFGINIHRMGREARFDEKLGRREGMLLGGEETDLCHRAIRAGLNVMYQGNAIVDHQVLPDRVTYHWIFRRLYYTGVNRAMLGGAPSPTHRMTVWDYVLMPIVLVPYTLGYLKGQGMRGKNP
jgi:glucosyl-dolichyl phosphate glucuronosyltransferase